MAFAAVILATVMYAGLGNPEEKAQHIPCPPIEKNQEAVAHPSAYSTFDLSVAHECLGIRLLIKKSYKESIETLIAATASSLDNAEIYNYIATDYNREGDYNSAIQYATKAVLEDARDADGYAARAWAYGKLADYPPAERDYSRAIAFHRSPLTLNGLGVIFYEEGKFDDALLAYGAALQMNGKFLPALQNRAIIYNEQGKADLALDDLNQAISLFPDDPKSYVGRATSYSKLKKFDLAADSISKAISLGDTNVQNYRYRSYYFRQMKEFNESIADVRYIIELEPQNSTFQSDLARIYEDMGQFDNALTAANSAVILDPKSADAYNQRAWILHLLGNNSAALPDAEQSIKLNPKSYAALETRAEIYEKLGRTSDALNDYKASLAINPSDPDASLGMKRLGGGP